MGILPPRSTTRFVLFLPGSTEAFPVFNTAMDAREEQKTNGYAYDLNPKTNTSIYNTATNYNCD